jgi:hypothetical protein
MVTPPFSRDDNATAIFVDDDTRIQILDSMPDLPRADKEQCGAFIVSSNLSHAYTSAPKIYIELQSVTNGYWLSGRTTWIASSHSAVILRKISSSWFGLDETRSRVSFLAPVFLVVLGPAPAHWRLQPARLRLRM